MNNIAVPVPDTAAERARFIRDRMPKGGLFDGHEWRISPTPFRLGPELAAEWRQNSTRVEFAAPGPGFYSVEMRIVPRHLDGLGASAFLAGSEYRWVLMNAIELR